MWDMEDVFMKKLSFSHKLTLSALVMALYVAIMAVTQGFAFGQFQVRIATSLYALAGVFPFLVLPLGFANFLSNALLGGLGALDMAGGMLIGWITSGIIALTRRSRFAPIITVLTITFVTGLGVASWLSYLLNVPYPVMAASLLVGQFICGLVGALLLTALKKRL